MVIDRVAQRLGAGTPRARSRWATWPSAWTPASVRPAPCTLDAARRRSANDGLLERLLHREPVRLALPADEAGAVIFDRQLEAASSRRTVPGGKRKPRRNAGRIDRRACPAAAAAAAAARLRRRRSPAGRRAPCRAQRSRASATDARRRARLMRSPSSSNQRPATGRGRAPGAPAPPPGGRQSSRASSRRQLGGIGDAVRRLRTRRAAAGGQRVAAPSTISRAPSAARRSCRLPPVVVGPIGSALARAASGRCRAPRPSA